MNIKILPVFIVVLVWLLSESVYAVDPTLELATAKGCFICHNVQHSAESGQPLAPSYQKIAERYRNDKSAFQYLVNRILHGTLYTEQNWGDEISMRFMPPNVNVTRSEASELTHWVLNLPVDEQLKQQLARHEAMLILSTRSGCTSCHLMDPPTDTRLMPLAPAFREIAARYRGNDQAKQQLVRSIMQGTRSVSKLWPNANMQFMPPNVALDKQNAEKLSSWILDLE